MDYRFHFRRCIDYRFLPGGCIDYQFHFRRYIMSFTVCLCFDILSCLRIWFHVLIFCWSYFISFIGKAFYTNA